MLSETLVNPRKLNFLLKIFKFNLQFTNYVLPLTMQLQQRNSQTSESMTAKELKVGSVIEIPVNISPEQMNVPTRVTIKRCSDAYLWFGYNSLQRMGRNTFDNNIKHFGFKIISL